MNAEKRILDACCGSRMLFAHFMKQSGLGEDLIGGYINCSQQGVNSLRNKVENEVSHNPTFRELYEKVRNKLNQSNG